MMDEYSSWVQVNKLRRALYESLDRDLNRPEYLEEGREELLRDALRRHCQFYMDCVREIVADVRFCDEEDEDVTADQIADWLMAGERKEITTLFTPRVSIRFIKLKIGPVISED